MERRYTLICRLDEAFKKNKPDINDFNNSIWIMPITKQKQDRLYKKYKFDNMMFPYTCLIIAWGNKLKRIQKRNFDDILFITGPFDKDLNRCLTKDEFIERYCVGDTFEEQFKNGENYYKTHFDDLAPAHFSETLIVPFTNEIRYINPDKEIINDGDSENSNTKRNKIFKPS